MTQEEKDFMVNVLSQISVQAGQDKALETITLIQSILTKLKGTEDGGTTI